LPSSSVPVLDQPPPFPETLGLSLLAFHRTVCPIRKQSEAKYGAFADLHTVLEAVTPALLEQGLVLTQSMEPTADGGCLLRTELTHAPTGDKLTSACPIPTLQTLLLRVHELRQKVLERYPLDLQLAALGGIPLSLSRRQEGAEDPLPAMPPREPGLRLDDQLKGAYTLLGQLGTTTNPLHSLGGTITYLRRYQVLSLLSLAPADDDGNGAALPSSPAEHRGASATTQPAAAVPARGRGRRGAVPPPESVRPQPTPPPAAAAPAAQTDPTPAPPPAAAASAPAAAPADPKLTPAEVQGLIGEIRSLPTESIPHLVAAFRQRFQLPAEALVSDYISTFDHAAFIRQQVAQLAPAAI
jgi:hypothetical protein